MKTALCPLMTHSSSCCTMSRTTFPSARSHGSRFSAASADMQNSRSDQRDRGGCLFYIADTVYQRSKIPAAGEGHRRDFVPIDRKSGCSEKGCNQTNPQHDPCGFVLYCLYYNTFAANNLVQYCEVVSSGRFPRTTFARITVSAKIHVFSSKMLAFSTALKLLQIAIFGKIIIVCIKAR